MEQVLIYAKNRNNFKPKKPSSEYDITKFKFRITSNKSYQKHIREQTRKSRLYKM